MDWGHVPCDVLGAALRATGSGAAVARAAAVCPAWKAAAQQPELWAELAARDLGVALAHLPAGRHPKEAYVEALTSEAWVWGLLPHGGPCPLPGGDTCAASLMAHTASGSRCVAPARLTAAPPPRCGAPAGPLEAAAAAEAAANAPARLPGAPPPRGARQRPLRAPLLGPGAAAAAPHVAAAAGTAPPHEDERQQQPSPRAAAPRAVAAGEDFVVVLSASGRLWDSRHMARHRHPNVKLADAGAALRGVVITAVAAGQHHVLALADGGAAFGWGANAAGQLGLGHRRPWLQAPVDVTEALRARWEAEGASGCGAAAVAAGAEHSALLMSSGDVYLAGDNASGQCARDPGPVAPVVAAWARAELPEGAAPAAAVALGCRNTAVVTAAGRILVCGDNQHGQCTPGAPAPPAPADAGAPGAPGAPGAAAAAGVCRLVDAGPDARWHGMARRDQGAAGGGGEAADSVVAAAVGRGCVYALTARGDVYQWGAPPAGGGGSGGPARAAAPARVPGVRGARAVAASAAGRFAAAVDDAGRLFTWGSGKSGQLGLNSTSKAATAREVKALRGLRVISVSCGTDHASAVTAWRPPRRGGGLSRTASGVSTGSRDDGGGGGGGGVDSPAKGPPDWGGGLSGGGSGNGGGYGGGNGGGTGRNTRHRGGGGGGGGGAAGGDEAPSPERRFRSADVRGAALHAALALEAATAAGGRRARHVGEASNGGGEEEGSSGGTPERRASTSGGGCRDDGGRGHDSEDCRGARRRWGKRGPAGAKGTGPGRGRWPNGGGGEDGGGSDSGDGRAARDVRQEKGVNFAVKRLLKAFASDPRQREITLPEALTSADRFRLHVLAEEWGLGHESRGEGAARAMTIWKPSRTRPRCAADAGASACAGGAWAGGEGGRE